MWLAFWLRRCVPASLMLGCFRGPLPLLSVHPIEKHSRATPTLYLDHICVSFSSVSFATFEKINCMKTTRWSEQGKCWISVHSHNASKKTNSVSRSSRHFYIYTFGSHLKGSKSAINVLLYFFIVTLPIITATCSLIGHI